MNHRPRPSWPDEPPAGPTPVYNGGGRLVDLRFGRHLESHQYMQKPLLPASIGAIGTAVGLAVLHTYCRVLWFVCVTACKALWFVWITVPIFLFVVVPLLVIRSAFGITLLALLAPAWLIAKLTRSITGEENTPVVRTYIIMKIHGLTWPYALPLCFEDRG
jgi:hypothetical protein